MGDHLCDETLWSMHCTVYAWSIRKRFGRNFLSDQTQQTTQEILAGEDLRNSLEDHKQLEEVLSAMGMGSEILDFLLEITSISN